MSSERSQRLRQNTLSRPAVISGRGLFHGHEATVRMLPGKPDSGIIFRRVDLRGRPEISADVDNVTSAPRRTVLSASGGATVETVEHLMAALAGMQVDNCIVEINSVEVPAVDGSCLPFCLAILKAGLKQQAISRTTLMIEESHGVNDRAGEQWIEVIPSSDETTTIDYRLDYGPQSAIPSQSFSVCLTPDIFLCEIAPARTFVLSEEVEALKSMGFGRHLTGKDLVVFDSDGTVVDNKLRWANEPVRHKILDCIGDLALSRRSFVGRIIACRSGHKLNHVMAKTLSTIDSRQNILQWAA